MKDARGIDTMLAELTGEGSQQAAPRPEKHVEKIAATWNRLPAPQTAEPSYYDRPLLKAPVWKAAVPLYYFVGGAAGASLVIGAAAQLDRTGQFDHLMRRCHWTGVIGCALSGALLVEDLGKLSRFHHMLRVFRPTSPMNMGVWIISAVSPSALSRRVIRKSRRLTRSVRRHQRSCRRSRRPRSFDLHRRAGGEHSRPAVAGIAPDSAHSVRCIGARERRVHFRPDT